MKAGLFCRLPDGEMQINQLLAEELGLPSREISWDAFSEHLIRGLQPSDQARFASLLTGESPIAEVDFQHPDGVSRHLHLWIRLGPQGEPPIAGITREVRRGDDSGYDIHQAPWFLTAILDGIEDGILVITPVTLQIQRANRGAGRLFGASPDKLIGKSVFEFIVKSDQQAKLAETISAKLPYLKMVYLDLEMQRLNGQAFPALHGISEIRDEAGNLLAWIWIITDMSQRVFLNHALVDLETRYRLLFERSADPLIILDAETEHIIDLNLSAERQLGYNRTELIGMTMREITPEARRQNMESDFKSILGGSSNSFEGLNLAKDGHEIPVQISVVATEFENRRVYIASCRDITEQKSLESERLRAENLETVRRMAGGLAHELSQPMQALMTACELLNRGGLSAEETRALVMKTSPSIDRMASLLEQMKSIVRVESKPYAGNDYIVDLRGSSSSIE